MQMKYCDWDIYQTILIGESINDLPCWSLRARGTAVLINLYETFLDIDSTPKLPNAV